MDYRTLIVAGFGNIGYAFALLGRAHFRGFGEILVIDRNSRRIGLGRKAFPDLRFALGDVSDASFVRGVLSRAAAPGMFVNLCSHLDTVRLRREIKPFDMAYIDCGCSEMRHAPKEARLSRLMPYTTRSLHGTRPHLVCQGINPGLVELAARLIMRSLGGVGRFSVSIVERDSLRLRVEREQKFAVGWSPQTLVEEMAASPALWAEKGRLREVSDGAEARVRLLWKGEAVKARRTAHEDIWSLARHPRVESAHFFYSLRNEVMDLIAESAPNHALRRLRLPQTGDALEGTDAVTVSVRNEATGRQASWTWEVSHRQTWEKLGINAVQWQTALGVIFSVLLCVDSGVRIPAGTYTMSNLPLTKKILESIPRLFDLLNINWRAEAEHTGEVFD